MIGIPGLGIALAGLLGFVCFAVFRPALDGAFISDDIFYVPSNPYIQALTLENFKAIFEPRGPAAVRTLNYAPIHLLAHALEWRAFGAQVHGYHVVNVWLHLAVTLLLVFFLRSTGIGRGASALGGTFFLLHPANVEAVAWIFQIKTLLSTGFALAALLTFRRLPALAAALFALGLLTKISAAFALPVAAVMLWCAETPERGLRRDWLWLLAWGILLCVIAVPVWGTIAHVFSREVAGYPSVWVHARSMVAIAARYLVMAATSYGVSAFQEPAAALSSWDPWWLAGLVILGLLAHRLVGNLLRHDPEAIHWTLALAAYAPVSQIIPFQYAMADHYLYAILPGLIGGTLVVARRGLLRAADHLRTRDAYARLESTLGELGEGSGRPAPGPLSLCAALALCLLCIGFAFHSHQRAGLWVSAYVLSSDSARHYPDGVHAHLIAAFDAAEEGHAPRAARALRAAFAGGYYSFETILDNPTYAAVRDHPELRAVLEDMARWWVSWGKDVESPTQGELRIFASAHYLLGELGLSIRQLEAALALGGPADAEIERELEARRLEKRLGERLGRRPDRSGEPR